MQCAQHPDRSASAICQRCDKMLCEECTADRGGRKFCATCAEFVDRRSATRRPAAAPAAASGGAVAPAAGDIYQGPPPAPAGDLYQGPPPAASGFQATPSPAPAGDLYQGPPAGTGVQPPPPPPLPDGDVYEGPDPDGDVYEGPDPDGDVYQGPSAGPAGIALGNAAVDEDSGFSIRGLLAGVFGVFVSAILYYWLFVEVELKFKAFALIMSLVVALAARLGAGRAGHDVGLMAGGLFVLSVIFGQYAVDKKFHEEIYAYDEEYRQAVQNIRIDGRYTEDEARRLAGYSVEEWNELSSEEKRWEQEILQAEYAEARAEGWDPEELYSFDEEDESERTEPTLSLGAYFKDIFFYLGFWGIFFIGVGSVQAYKIAATESS